ncbi:hypothetical protein DEU56DRAFT_893632 [Suillus clintonianus]|uniref:uncharacterized protein n=1 Tax=Suillus clintonianus TaxID=1904413 RepID=UPI001B867DF6|nr:uncharacterized protein DEU56DRAFT_893632 [Suillus clintonianus]KAG2123457.1 hypothetical protein DEU56DRAFT_893632 [Suillus clintonianus]
MVHNFFVVLKTDLHYVTTSDNARIRDIFDNLESKSIVARRVLRGILYHQCDYYKLKNPVLVPDRVVPADIVPECLDKSNWHKVTPLHRVRSLAQSISNDYVYIVIIPDEGAAERIIAALNRDHKEIFSRLQIRVSRLQRWTMDDVTHNMAGGRLYLPDNKRPVELSEIEASLTQRRTYNVPSAPESGDYQSACEYPEHFHNIFESTLNQSGTVTDREFVAFFNVLRCFHKDSKHLSTDSSSALKTSNFMVYFIGPPFFSSRSFDLKEKTPLNFPIFIGTDDQPNSWCQFHPSSDLMVSSPLFGFPFPVCEVVSQKKEEDRCRMLLQAITIVRAGQYLMADGAPKPFFVVAIYLRANLTAERYVVTHTTPTEDQEDRQVSIAQKDFDLTTADGAVTFLREMYNLAAMLEELAKHLDKRKQDSLVKVDQDAASLRMISLASKVKKDKTGGSTLASTVEDDTDEEPRDDLGVFGTDDIKAILKKMNYKIDFIPYMYPLIAAVSNRTDESEEGYLKFVEEGGQEIEILRYLTGFDSPANHTISGVQIWPVRGGDVISMPVSGAHLTSLTNPSAHLWSVAKQLFEAVDFMHQHGVAHMDLKPKNILIPVDGGRLTVIDFNRSLRVKGVEHKFRGTAGTPEYIAPEVAAGKGNFSAIRADLWSCGKTLEELCNKCRPSTDRDTLLEISSQLMDEDPKKRPMMTEVLDRLTRCTVGIST